MNDTNSTNTTEIIQKIARLVEEKGWNQEDFAKMTGLNRQTIRQILHPTGDRRLRNNTIAACAKALDLTVHDLRSLSLERLLLRINRKQAPGENENLQRLYAQASQPELRAWLERNPQRSQQLTPEEMDELVALQGSGGALASFGVEHFVSQLERRRELVEQVKAIASTEYIDLLEQMVGLIYDRIHSSQ